MSKTKFIKASDLQELNLTNFLKVVKLGFCDFGGNTNTVLNKGTFAIPSVSQC